MIQPRNTGLKSVRQGASVIVGVVVVDLEIDYVVKPRQEVVVYSKRVVYVMLERLRLGKKRYGTLRKKQSLEIAMKCGSTEGKQVGL